MEIQSGTSISTISLASFVRATSGQGKVSFPVKSNDLAYTNFKNIKIVPSESQGSSYSISRLRALDNLIEQLNRIKGQNKIETPELEGLDSNALDSLIKEFTNEMHSKLDIKTPYKPSVESTGLLVDVLL